MANIRKPNILYSAGTELAFKIAERYYDDLHYVWCTSKFGSQIDLPYNSNPASSNPFDIYNEYRRESGTQGRVSDHHGNAIARHRTALKKGADAKLISGVISEGERNEIYTIVDHADARDFCPLLYLIPFVKAESLLKRVPITERAHPFSEEWVIEELPRDYFDLLRF